MRINKIAWLYGICLIAVEVSGQQKPQPKPFCDCVQVADDLRNHKFYPTLTAQKIIDSYCGLFRHPAKIYPKPYACNALIYSMICGVNEEKYIFYKDSFLDELTAASEWGDQFVLAHEISHHLLGHTERAYRLGRVQDILNKHMDDTKDLVKDKKETIKDYNVSIPQRHLHELEADALGLWMVIQRKADRRDMKEIFKALPRLFSVYDRNFDSNTSTDSHPSMFIRQRFIERNWDRYEKQRFTKRYAAIDENSNYKALAEDAEEFYAFQLLSADKEQQAQFNKTELGIRDSLSRRSRFFADVVLGGMVQRPVLHRGNETIAATDSRSPSVGIRLGIGAWYRPSRLEIDLKAAASSFTTQATFADGLRTVEEFKTTYLYVQPRYVYSRMKRLAKYAYRTSGLMATVGASASIPLQYTYVNYVAPAYSKVDQRIGFAPVVGIGYGISNWHTGNGHFRFWLMYQPQPMRFAIDSSEKVSACLHTLSLDFSFRFW